MMNTTMIIYEHEQLIILLIKYLVHTNQSWKSHLNRLMTMSIYVQYIQGAFLNWSLQDFSKCQPVSKFWHLKLFWCYLTLGKILLGPVKKCTMYDPLFPLRIWSAFGPNWWSGLLFTQKVLFSPLKWFVTYNAQLKVTDKQLLREPAGRMGWKLWWCSRKYFNQWKMRLYSIYISSTIMNTHTFVAKCVLS